MTAKMAIMMPQTGNVCPVSVEISSSFWILGNRAVPRKPPTDQTIKSTRHRLNGKQALTTDMKPIDASR